MALFDRNNDRGYGGDYRGMNRGTAGQNREGLWSNSWSDGAWTADAADRTERDWHLGGGRYDRDVRGGMGMNRGGMQGGMSGGGMSGGMGMNRGGMDRGGMNRDHGWNLEGGDWGHNWGSGNLGSGSTGYGAGGMDRDRGMNRGGFLDRAQNAIRRGWDQVEDRFDRDDERHMGGGAMRGGTSWVGNYDRDMGMRGETGMRGDTGVRGYRDDEGHYGVTRAPGGMNRGYGGGMSAGGMSGGRNRYGMDYDRGMTGRGRYDSQYRGGRNWF